MERLLSGVLVGVVELDSEPEGAVLLHRGTHEQPPLKKWTETEIRLCLCTFSASVRFGIVFLHKVQTHKNSVCL